MRKLSLLLLFLLMFFIVNGQNIEKYVTFSGYGVFEKSGKEVIVLRKYSLNDRTYYFVVLPESLETMILVTDSIKIYPESWQFIRNRFSSTPYVEALIQVEQFGNTLQDAGFRQFMPTQKGIDLTIDLCPSIRPLDRVVFTDLIHEVGQVEKPVPIAISITGRWMNMHPDDLNWLKEMDKSDELNIVWVNHSYNHYTEKGVPLKMNFMLAPGTDINTEVLNTEIAMLERNITPSVFFRFPGLVSDQQIYSKIVNLGLIPIGSDAWLAKGQWPVPGSIVLIHANGNEPIGVQDFINLLRKERTEILSKHWELYDLRESIVDSEPK